MSKKPPKIEAWELLYEKPIDQILDQLAEENSTLSEMAYAFGVDTPTMWHLIEIYGQPDGHPFLAEKPSVSPSVNDLGVRGESGHADDFGTDKSFQVEAVEARFGKLIEDIFIELSQTCKDFAEMAYKLEVNRFTAVQWWNQYGDEAYRLLTEKVDELMTFNAAGIEDEARHGSSIEIYNATFNIYIGKDEQSS